MAPTLAKSGLRAKSALHARAEIYVASRNLCFGFSVIIFGQHFGLRVGVAFDTATSRCVPSRC
jgi:hypothetical protein